MKLSDRGAIEIDDYMRTNVPHIYAIGDCTGKLLLAHSRGAGSGRCRDHRRRGDHADQLRHDSRGPLRSHRSVPSATPNSRQRTRATTSKPPSSRSSRTARHTAGEATGFVKIVADAKRGEILGLHMIGPDVTELLPELTLAQLWDLTSSQVARNIHAHPTLSEALKSGAWHLRPHDQPVTASAGIVRCPAH